MMQLFQDRISLLFIKKIHNLILFAIVPLPNIFTSARTLPHVKAALGSVLGCHVIGQTEIDRVLSLVEA